MSLNKVNKSSDFIINQVSRLYPTYWSCVTITFILIYLFPCYIVLEKISAINYIANMSMFQFYLRRPDLDDSYWTMIIEMIFYLSILFLFHFKLLKYLNTLGIFLSLATVIVTNFWYDNVLIKDLVTGIPLFQFIPLFFAGTVFYKIYTSRNKLFQNYCIIIFALFVSYYSSSMQVVPDILLISINI